MFLMFNHFGNPNLTLCGRSDWFIDYTFISELNQLVYCSGTSRLEINSFRDSVLILHMPKKIYPKNN